MSIVWDLAGNEMSINDLKLGDTAIISKCDTHRLIEHGFTVGTQVTIYSKTSHITCINLRGTILACRKSDCAGIEVEKL